MNPMIRSKLLAAAMCAVTLVGCNAVEDVREPPFNPVPAQGVVLKGIVTGTLGRQRSLTLINNGDDINTVSVSYTLGTEFSPFTFGVRPVGSPYNVTVKANPYGKICTVSGGTGVITTAEALNIVVNCVNDPAVTRYDVRVHYNSTFANSEGAQITLTTEEGAFSMTPDPGNTFVTFPSAVFHNVLNGVTNTPVFTWTVTASNTVGSTPTRPLVNKCVVTNSTNPGGASPTANIGMAPAASTAWPTVGSPAGAPVGNPCQFTIGGTVFYTTPTGGAAQTMPAGGLDLQLRDVQGNVVETKTITSGYGTSGTNPASIAGTAYTFDTVGRSNPGSVYDVAVSRHPTGHYCVVANGGAATLGVATANITNANVACRALPAPANRLRGTYGFYDGVTFNYPNPTPAAATTNTLVRSPDGTLTTTTIAVTTFNTRTTYQSTTNPGLGGESRGQVLVEDIRTRTTVVAKPPNGPPATISDQTVDSVRTTTNTNTTRNFVTFFEDGTFLAGAHGPGTGIFLTNSNQIEHGFYAYDPVARVIRFTLVTDTVTAGGTTSLLNTALSGTAGSTAASGTALATATMTNVTKSMSGTRARLTGEFGDINNSAIGARWATWNMLEPKNTDGQTEGPWVSQDHRRAWSYDNNTTLGFHVGVNNGAANLQDACFTYENFRDPTGFYTRRGGLTGCLEGLAGVVPVDIPSAGVGTPNTLTQLPGFVGRVPGSETAFDGRSPSPIFYAIGTKDTLGAIADPVFFPPADVTPAALSWCSTEIYALRSSLHGNPINFPVYFCRERAN